jgi:hypothetical protein
MFSKREIITWLIAAIVGVFLAYACRLEAVEFQNFTIGI